MRDETMNIERLREEAKRLCQEHGINVVPYGSAWWIIGEGINRVFGELAGLKASDLTRLPVMAR